MEKIATAVPLPLIGLPGVNLLWTVVCTDHPNWVDSAPTDRFRESAESLAAACACAHPGHKRRRDYPTGNADGMSFICNRWVFTGPQGYRVTPNGDGTFHVVSYNAAETRLCWLGEDSRRMTEDAAHELAASLARTTPHPVEGRA